ncbi:MAG: GNAT family N-acetyltransferase [Atopobiaceae bacterium]|nr:GNAT family N-acetyltransferase [Atopobiaceae bacterium]
MSISDGVYMASSAVITGDVSLGEGCSVWYGAVLRGDMASITIGARTNIQDNAVVHVSSDHPVRLGEGVTVGHGAIVHGCEVGNNTLVGMGSIVLNGARIGDDCIIGAGALVLQNMVVPSGSVVVGSPARVLRDMTRQDIEANRANADSYVRQAQKALQSSRANDSRRASMLIRRAQAGDIPGIAKLLLQVAQVHADGRPDLFMSGGTKYTDAELATIIADDERPIFVAVDEYDAVLGYAFCVFEDYAGDTVRTPIRTLYIDDICVDEAARGRHVGSAVYEHVIDYARKEGFYNVTLNVWSCNPGAQAFYEAMGMTPYKVGMEQIL